MAAVVVLAGGGAAAALLLTRDSDKGTTTTTLWSTTGPTSTSTSTTLPSTTATVTSTTKGTTSTTKGSTPYEKALLQLENVLSTADGYVTSLGEEAARTIPNIPQAIYDELQATFDQIEEARLDLLQQDLPAEYQQADIWIQDAAIAQQARIDYAMRGIGAIWYSGDAAAGEPYFSEARAQRQYFAEAFDKYFASLP